MPHLSPALLTDDLIFTSGQLGFGAGGKLVGDDVASQTRQAIANIQTVLAGHGVALTDVLKTTVWLTDVALFADFDAAYAEAFGAHKPARSTTIAGLVVKGGLVEIEAIARRRI
jgi:2-iminobutanoate/2-iminopropanoate deaminase